MTAGAAARPAPSCPRVESIWAFPEGYEVTARAATETATRLLSNQGRPEAWIPGELFGTDIPPSLFVDAGATVPVPGESGGVGMALCPLQ